VTWQAWHFGVPQRGCIMTDRVELTAPFGILGRLVEKLVLRRYLERLIAHRGRFLAGATSRTGAH
jgi:hypothetical protein